MAFFDELGKKISETGQGVVQKTKGTAETMKLNSLISDEEKTMENLYTEMGKTYFRLHADSSEPLFAGLIAGIKQSQAKIEQYSEQVKKLKGIVRCPSCGGEVPYGAPFCSSCGAGMAVRHCVKCGAALAPGVCRGLVQQR